MGLVLPCFNILLLLMCHSIYHTDGGDVGVNYGLLGDNLPSPAQAINLLKSINVNLIRIFSPNHDILSAIYNSGSLFRVIVGTFNDDVPKLATDTNFAINWVQTNIIPFASLIKFQCISVGNEIIPGNLASSVLAAMENLDAAVKSLGYSIPVSTSIGFAELASSYPPSSGDFKDKEIMRGITGYLTSHGYPLLLTAYPYFAYASDPSHIQLSYALMNSTETFVRDGDLEYKNMFDAMVDSVYSAAEKVGAGGLDIVVAESGWPSNGNGEYTTPSLAQTYNQNLARHAGSGTPKNPGKTIETYVFAIFNENQKTPGVEQNFGLFYPDMTEVYHIDF